MSFTTKFPTLPPTFCPCPKIPPQKSTFFPKIPPKFQPFTKTPPKFQPFTKKPQIFSKKSEPTNFSQVISYPDDEKPQKPQNELVSIRLQRLVSEFKALSEPIDRVKRLLGYASVLSQLGESTRSPENRVRGCAAQVWLEVKKDENGRMRFGADSDSEITKGFCSCLIFLLDGAFPRDVLKVKAEDLTDMNVGLPVRSRVNSWHNVLVNMQERTKTFVSEDDQELCQRDDSLGHCSSLVVPPDTLITKGEVCVS